MNLLSVVNSTSVTSTSTVSTPVCQVYAAGNYVGNCTALSRYFAPAPWYTEFWIGLLIAVVVLFSGFGIYVYYNYPFGRFFWHKKGIKAVMHFSGSPAILGTLTLYLDKIFLFVSSGSERKKNRVVRLIPAVPGAISHLRQADGGDSFCLIDGDKGLPVSAELEAWASKNLNALADSHDWNHFALKTKYDMLSRSIAEANLFPKIQDWNPGTETVTLLTHDGHTFDASGTELMQKQAKDCSVSERVWYLKTSDRAEAFLKDAMEAQAKTRAILAGEDFYAYGGKTIELPARKKTEWVSKITEELAHAGGDIGNAILGGVQVTGQYVASVLSNVPDGIYFDSAQAKIEEKVRKEMKKDAGDLMKMAIVALVLMGGIGIILLVLSKNLG